MAKIRNLGYREFKQVSALLADARAEASEMSDSPVLGKYQILLLPVHKLNHLLPTGWKFWPEIYVASLDGRVQGLIWMSRDGYATDRWKIEQIILNPDANYALDVGQQLTQYVVHKFGAAGIETFLAYVDIFYSEGLALLKQCGFRHCTKLHHYGLEDVAQFREEQPEGMPKDLREMRASDAKPLAELYADTLAPEVRMSLSRRPKDFYAPWYDQLKRRVQGEFYKRWVMPCAQSDNLWGSVALSTSDFKQFHISLMASAGWEEGLKDLLSWAVQQARKSASKPRFTLQAYEFQKAKLECIEQCGFQRLATTEILVKDYWIPLGDKSAEANNPVLLFAKAMGKTSPA